MDLYISSLLLGAVGLGAMVLGGLGHHGGGHAGHGGHGGHLHIGHGHGHGAPGHGGHAGNGAHGHSQSGGSSFIWAIMSPRVLFSFAVGFGAVGELVDPVSSGPLRLALAVLGGLAFERF